MVAIPRIVGVDAFSPNTGSVEEALTPRPGYGTEVWRVLCESRSNSGPMISTGSQRRGRGPSRQAKIRRGTKSGGRN